MTSRVLRWGCAFGAALLVVLAAGAAGWWLLRSRARTAGGPPPSQVHVFLVTPASGEDVEVGDYIPVTLNAVAPAGIAGAELFVNGKSVGVVTDSPEKAWWTWQAWPAGVHTLSARAIAGDGEVGQSQTVIVNVLPGDGQVLVPAEEGQTLAEVGQGYGIAPDPMSAANPALDPSLPLPAGQPVQVPVPSEPQPPAAPPGPLPPGQPGGPVLITWEFTPTEPVDQSYCYVSLGSGSWQKLPQKPFTFLPGGGQVRYPDYGHKLAEDGETGSVKAECWAWVGGILKFLGQGESSPSTDQPPDMVMIQADGFRLTGLPDVPIPVETFTGGSGKVVPPPFALREASDAAECAQHFGNPLAGFVCNTLLTAPVKEYRVLVWEWAPQACWPGDCPWVNQIGGYQVYEIDPLTGVAKYMKTINDPDQRATAVPIPWGARCYGIQAFVDDPNVSASLLAKYCPGDAPPAEEVVLKPVDWLTTGGMWIQDGDCPWHGGGDSYLLAHQNSGFGNNGEVLVGSYIVDDDEDDCFRQGDYAGAVRFAQPLLPPGAVLHQAILVLHEIHTEYGATGLAAPKPWCVAGVGSAKQTWSGLGGPDHFVGKNLLIASAYLSPFTSISMWDTSPEIDVTPLVASWFDQPAQNNGFILTPSAAPSPLEDGQGVCETGVGGMQLIIRYFAP